MSILKNIYRGTLGVSAIGDSESVVYTVPAGKKAMIKAITAVNTDSVSTISFSVSIDSDLLVNQISVLAGKSYEYSTVKVLNSGDKIYANSSVSGITLHIDGAEI